MFAYPGKTKIVLYGTSSAGKLAYYKYRSHFEILGFMSSGAQSGKFCGIDILPNSQILPLCRQGAKIIVLDNDTKCCRSLSEKRGLKLYDNFLPVSLFEYEMIDCLELYSMCSKEEFARVLSILMRGKKGALINGNCQTEPIAKYLRYNERFSKEYVFLKTTVVHRFTEQNIGILSDKAFLDCVSLFMTQKISLNNNHCREASSELMFKKLPDTCKKVMINNYWFQGYFPQHKKNEYNVLTDMYTYGAFNWGDEILDKLVAEGRNADEIYAFAKSNKVVDKKELEELIASQFADMRAREKPCDIKMADYIEENYKKRVLFYSCNHPVNELLKLSATKILRFIGLYAEDEPVRFRYESSLDSKPMLKSVTETIYPAVLHHLGMNDIEDDLSYSVLFGEFCDFDNYVKNYLSFCHGVFVDDGE